MLLRKAKEKIEDQRREILELRETLSRAYEATHQERQRTNEVERVRDILTRAINRGS